MDRPGHVHMCPLILGLVSLSYDLLFPFCRHGNRGLRSHRPETAQPDTPGRGLQGPETSFPHLTPPPHPPSPCSQIAAGIPESYSGTSPVFTNGVTAGSWGPGPDESKLKRGYLICRLAGCEQLGVPHPLWPGCQEGQLNDSVTPVSPVTPPPPAEQRHHRS